MKKILWINLIFTILLTLGCSKQKENKQPYVVMLSVDGFRWDYPDSVATPNLDKMAEIGVKAKSIIPSYPTKTFPNHYSMATGLYPDHHGIVMNSFYDPDLDAYYSIGDRKSIENPEFYGGEPIWVTAEKQGMKSASYFWVGSETPIKGIQPSIWKKYEHHFPFEQRLDSVISWLQLPEEKRPHLITWYIHEPDGVGHKYGPQAPETRKTLRYLDSLIGVFNHKISQLPNAKDLNIIVTADHGMGPIYPDSCVYLDKIIPKNWIEIVEGGNPAFNIKAKEGCIDSIMDILKQTAHIQAWKAEEIPQRLHYGSNPRVLDINVVADSAWSVDLSTNKKYASGGTHGYDNQNTDMHAIFYAYGPAFKKNHIQPSFNNVDLYILIANILGLQPEATDGDFDHVKGMLRNTEESL